MIVTSPIPEYELVAPKEAIIAWKHDEVTTQILNIIRMERDASRTRIVSPEILGDNMIQQVSRAVGYVEGLEFLLSTIMEVTKFVEDKEDND